MPHVAGMAEAVAVGNHVVAEPGDHIGKWKTGHRHGFGEALGQVRSRERSRNPSLSRPCVGKVPGDETGEGRAGVVCSILFEIVQQVHHEAAYLTPCPTGRRESAASARRPHTTARSTARFASTSTRWSR